MRTQRRWCAVAASAAAIAAAPSIGAAPQADQRFHVYTSTAAFGWNPWAIVDEAITSVPSALERGNFRPGGRIVEWTGDVIAGQSALLFGVPVNVSLGVLRLIAAAGLAAAIMWLVGRVLVTEARPVIDPALSASITFLLGAAFMVSSTSGPVSLFPWLYLGTGAAAIVATGALTPERLYDPNRSMTRTQWIGFGVLGVVLAGVNEVTALAIPIGAAVIASRGLALGVSLATLRRAPVLRAFGVQAVGFLVVFVPVRWMITGHCVDGTCYSESDLLMSSAYPSTVVGRVGSAFLAPQWRVGSNDPALDALRAGDGVLVAAAFAVLAIPLLYLAVRAPDAPTERSRDLAPLLVLGGSMTIVPALVFGTSRILQEPSLRVGEPWRDSTLTTPGAALVTAAVGVWLLRWASPRLPIGERPVVAVVGLGVLFASFVTTWAVGVEARTDIEHELNNDIAIEAITFGEADDRRCELLESWALEHRDQGRPGRPQQLESALNAFVVYAHGAPGWCGAGS